jgi:hypothetical protein
MPKTAASMTSFEPADLQRVIERQGRTHDATADCVGVDVRTVERWLDGTRTMPEPMRRVFAMADRDPKFLDRMHNAGLQRRE